MEIRKKEKRKKKRKEKKRKEKKRKEKKRKEKRNEKEKVTNVSFNDLFKTFTAQGVPTYVARNTVAVPP